jgi:hypothetical protein
VRWRSRLASLAALAAVATMLVVALLTLMPLPRLLGTFWPRWSATLGLTLLFTLACLAVGRRVVEWLTPTAPRDGELALSLAAGVVLFGLALGGLGLLQALDPAIFWLLPLGGLALGLAPLARWGVRMVGARPGWTLSAAELALLGAGVLAVALLWAQVLSPDNLNFDARWYHLRAAERAALAHGQVRTPEGDYLLALPQLASWLYTWALMAPLPTLTDRLQLALHLELVTVLATLTALPPLTRALFPKLPRPATRLAWVALFVFPSPFIYDTGLFGGADHVAALWTIPLVLGWLQARARADWSSWVLWGVLAAGCLAKYTSLLVLLPVALAALVDLGLRWRATARAQRWGPFVAGATTVALAAPWWLKNWLFYHDPLYPMAPQVFGATPFEGDAAAQLARVSVPINFFHGAVPAFGGEWTLGATLGALADHWHEVYTWGDFTGGQPAFGFMFLVALLGLPFVRGGRLAWLVAGLCALGVALWFNVKHEMRYLGMLAPLMAAVVAGVAAAFWGSRRLELRAAVLAAVVVQLLVYGDLPFRKTHRLNGQRAPVEAGLDALGRPSGSSPAQDSWAGVNAVLPPDAVPLIHGVDLPLGLARQSVTDVPGLQFGLSAGRAGTVAALHRRLRDLGVTHLVWTSDVEQLDSLAGEILFRSLAHATSGLQQVGHRLVGELPPEPPPEPGSGVLYVGCHDLYPTGLYRVPDLAAVIPNWPLPFAEVTPGRTAGDWRELVPLATWVVAEEGCGADPGPDFVSRGLQTAPHRAWRHFQRLRGNEGQW